MKNPEISTCEVLHITKFRTLVWLWYVSRSMPSVVFVCHDYHVLCVHQEGLNIFVLVQQ